MIEKIKETIHLFLEQQAQHTWIENHLGYFLFLGTIIFLVLFIKYIIKIQKEINKQKDDERKRYKRFLKFISNKKNKTW